MQGLPGTLSSEAVSAYNLLTGLVLSLVWFHSFAPGHVSAWNRVVLLFSGMIGGLVVARLSAAFLFLGWSLPLSLDHAVSLRGGGYSVLGFVLGACCGAAAASRLLGLRVALVVDSVAIPMLLAQILGRLGCFLHGCCFGVPSNLSWATRYEALSPAGIAFGPAGLHPVQLYEMVGCAFLLVFVARARVSQPTGVPAIVFVGGYSVLRLCMESVRGDAPAGWRRRVAVLTSLAVVAAVLRLWFARTGKPAHRTAPGARPGTTST